VFCLGQFLLGIVNSHAQQFTYYSWNDYKGNLGTNTVYFSVFPEDEGVMVGNYFFAGSMERIALQGSWNKDSIVLKAMNKDKTIGWFKAKLNASPKADLNGVYANLKGDTLLKFNFKLSGICAGDFKNRYSFLYGTDAELEAFSVKIKSSLETNEKVWLSSSIQYPLQVQIEGKPFLLRSRQQFMEQYNKIFDKDFKDKILAEPFINLHSTAEGVQLAGGLIWIYNTKKSNEEKYEYIITKINK
jgi:hypothetical protein